jgi:aminoglycoside phosphotransferase (APT) family kinase protein
VVDAMADLHLLRPRDCGLGELGRPAGFVARQVAGWRARWNLAKPAHAPEVMAQIGIRLEASLPTSGPPSILHNDLKLDNCQFDPANPDRVNSVFDWDMATLGDPLVDLGTLLSYWPDPSDSRDACRATHPGLQTIGLPRRSEIVDRYGLRTGSNVDNVGWYEALAQWKTAVVVQQLYNRYLRGETSDPRMKELGSRMPRLAAGASAILDQMMGV